MQTNAWFIKDIEDTGQPGTNLGGKTDPLGLTTGKGAGLSVQGKIAKTHPLQEGQPFPDLF